MPLRPATPLSILLGGAFVLLLLSVLSVPIIKNIPLGDFNGNTFGVFGFCQADGSCSGISVGYDIDSVASNNKQAFDLPDSVRKTLVSILVVHPVAALLTLIMFILAVVSHVHGPSHSSRYLLLLFIFTVIDFLVCLLAFIIDALLFIPHLAWGSYIVLAATIMVLLSGLISCIMRRTVVGRKSRAKRIAENAEMSGENYYNREAQNKAAVGFVTEPTVPSVSGGNGATDTLPSFTSLNDQRKADHVSEERVPLTQRSPVERSPNGAPNEMNAYGNTSAVTGPSRSQSRDRYGNPINRPPDQYGVARAPSAERMNARGRSGYPGYRGGSQRGGMDYYGRPMRGRGGGGYGPPGRGGYGPRGGRGGYGPPQRGAYGPGGMRGGRPPPPGAYGNMQGSYDRRPSPAEQYGPYRQGSSDPATGQAPGAGGYEPYNPDSAGLPRAESPPPMAGSEHAGSTHEQAFEMDATPGDPPKGFGQYGGLRESDADVAGMVGLQQGHAPGPHDTYVSEESRYSQDGQYVPPRAAWNGTGSGRNSPRVPSPLNVRHQQAAELPESPTHNNNSTAPPDEAAPMASGNYYEDVEPQFANPSPPHNQPPPIEPVYEDVHATVGGSRSPAESERSNFTSISQRGVNPHWNPPPPMPHHYPPPHHRRPAPQQQQRQDMLLDMPDFQVPGGASSNSKRGGPGMIPGSAYPTGPM